MILMLRCTDLPDGKGDVEVSIDVDSVDQVPETLRGMIAVFAAQLGMKGLLTDGAPPPQAGDYRRDDWVRFPVQTAGAPENRSLI